MGKRGRNKQRQIKATGKTFLLTRGYYCPKCEYASVPPKFTRKEFKELPNKACGICFEKHTCDGTRIPVWIEVRK